MADNLADRSGNLVETHKGYDPRTIFFYFIVAALLIALSSGLAYQQLFKTDTYHERERQQNQRRILIPGPRGNIYDREGRLLVGNRARFSIKLHLDELRKEFLKETRIIRKNYRELGDKDIPSSGQMAQIARFSVVQRYLDKVNAIIGRSEKLEAKDLDRHFRGELLLPFTLIEDLTPEEYAKLLEQLPIKDPLQVYASSTRYYPYGAAASHVLGYVAIKDNIDLEAEFTAKDLATFNDKNTFKMRGTVGKTGVEAEYDNLLQGDTGGIIYRVDPAGYRVEPPVYRHFPTQGKDLTLSLDIDLQQLAEEELAAHEDLHGAAVAIDVNSGEVLALASMPYFDLNKTSPHILTQDWNAWQEKRALYNNAVAGLWPPGSTFKILVAIAGLRSGTLTPQNTETCTGYTKIGPSLKSCDNGTANHGTLDLREAIAQSCDIYFYRYGVDKISADVIAAEARRFHLDKPTGIEIPGETRNMIIPDPAWKRAAKDEPWFPGDTANISIGQGDVRLTPLQMACFAASVARKQAYTRPTLEHHVGAPPQNNESIGLTNSQYAAILDGMEGCVTHGTAKLLMSPALQIPKVKLAGKTGTAQLPGRLNMAWFICFAPKEKPEIAIAVALQSDIPGDQFSGGLYAAPIAAKIVKKYFDKKTNPASPTITKPLNTTISLPPDPFVPR